MLFPEQTPFLVASNIILIAIMFLLLQPVYVRGDSVPKWRTIVCVICALVFCLFSFWGKDWFHYQNDFWRLKRYPYSFSHMEDVYLFLIKICPNYFTFRLAIWGPSLLLFHLTIKKLELNTELAWFIFGVLYIPLFAYGRFSLAIALMFYGSALLTQPYKNTKKISSIFGLLLIITSVFFHKSAIIGVGIICFALIIKTLNKNSLLLIFGVFILCVIIVNVLIPIFLKTNFNDDVEFAQRSQKYIGREVHENAIGIAAIIYKTLERIPYYLIALLCYKTQSEYNVPKGIEFMLKFFFFLVFFASIFAFDTGANTSIFYVRVLRFSLIPAAIILTYAHQYRLYPKLTKYAFLFSLASVSYYLAYNLYLSFIE